MALLEVIAMSAADAKHAEAGGADRLELVGTMEDDGLSPAPDLIEKVRLVTTIQVRPMLRLRPGFGTDGGEVTRLKGLIASYLDAGADGVVLGFLNGANQVDAEVVTELVGDGDVPYTFHRAIDHCLDQHRAWRAVKSLPGRLTHVLTAGSAIDVDRGLSDLIARATSDPDIAKLTMAGGGLLPEHVPWLVRAGIHAFHVGSRARPGGSYKAYVDADLVHSWRSLIDDEIAHERRRLAAAH
ncbi:MAG: copper homeostasis protein CutC [Propionibacterium sp.]|nr:copper homeostasis protein CutC [Propionibacterium sp.]